MIKISSYLMRTRSLISIDLTNNQIGERGGFAVSLVIKENTQLRIIKLGMNRIDDYNGSKIIKLIAKNEYLEELDLSANDLGQLVRINLITIFKNIKIYEKNIFLNF